MALYLKQGKPVFLLNTLAGDTTSVASNEALPQGTTALELDVQRGPGAPQAAADYAVTIKAGGRVLARQTVRFAMPASFGISETFGVGIDNGSAVLPGAAGDAPFAGRIADVVFDFNSTSQPAPSASLDQYSAFLKSQ
jgi:hypothetical protein